jgi:thymidylate synthase (FAD)
MKVIEQTWTWHSIPPLYSTIVFSIARAARNCYQSEVKSVAEEEEFIRKLIKRGHHSPLEHVSFSLFITTDRGVLAELTRHRLSSYSVESSRYVKYDEVEFIKPVWVTTEFSIVNNMGYVLWTRACTESEGRYKNLLDENWTPQQARQVLNMSLKTDIVMTSNLRQWRLILQQRTSKDAHPQMRALMDSILDNFKKEYPCLFGDL